MTPDLQERLAQVKRFDQLVAFLRDELGWPIDRAEWDELTFDYTPEELGIDTTNAAKIQEIRRLRPLSARQPWGIFFVKFEPKRLPVVVLRRILSQVVVKKRAGANPSDRAVWAAGDLLFISNYGEGDKRTISFAHFSQPAEKGELPTLRVLGWNNLDTPLHLENVAGELVTRLAWPSDVGDLDGWRAKWSSAFSVRHGEVVATSKELSVQLAKLAREIHDRARTALSIENERGPLTRMLNDIREGLVHDLSVDDFADMYAQTIAYGLLSARISNPEKQAADELMNTLRTSPFLRDLMATFLKAGGRTGKMEDAGLDFDELGVNDVVQLLDAANMPAILRDFGDRNPDEDPVIHFYELFLTEYDAKKRVQRGVFYTPRPVVSYIVRNIDRLLMEEFGLSDGLADTASWAEVARNLGIPELPDGVSPEEPFVQILDPATGTGTFLVEVIGVVHARLTEKWVAQKRTGDEVLRLWNEYVPKYLLPRLHGFELLMAPYAIAHVKVGLKLYETGYRFGSEEPARIFLSNSLEPPSDVGQQSLKRMFSALAQEAQAVNEVKRRRRFTVILGNPPYSGHSLNNQVTSIVDLVYDYKRGYPDLQKPGQAKWLQDDYVKFLRFAEAQVERSKAGAVGFITNHAWLDNPTFKGMRRHLLNSFHLVRVVDLHGNANKRETAQDGSADENVFEIKQGVAISLLARTGSGKRDEDTTIQRADLLGSAAYKYDSLARPDSTATTFSKFTTLPPEFLFAKIDDSLKREFDAFTSLPVIFGVVGDPAPGIVTTQDDFAISFSASEQAGKVERLLATRTEAEAREVFTLCSQKQWDYTEAKKALRRGSWRKEIVPILYRPFDKRFTVYDRYVAVHRRERVSRHLLSGDNLGLISVRQVAEGVFNHAYVSDTIVESRITVSNKGIGFVLPLWLAPDGRGSPRIPNIARDFIGAIRGSTELSWIDSGRLQSSVGKESRWDGRGDLSTSFGPRDIFDYVYAVLHSQIYRDRYAQFLKSDFARIPATPKSGVFRDLVQYGHELVGLHVLDPAYLPKNLPEYFGPPNPVVGKVAWDGDTIRLDAAPSLRGVENSAKVTGFRGVPGEVWRFHMAGYQVCDKWLKERKGRKLSSQELLQFRRIVGAVSQTIHTMVDIDGVIETGGGWPGAFQSTARSGPVLGGQTTLSGDIVGQSKFVKVRIARP